MVLLIIYLLIALFFSFLCSILEAVLLSITPSYVESLSQAGNELGPKLGKLKENIDRPLAAILSLNTIAHTVGAAGVGAQAAKLYGNDYLGLVSALLTLLILVFSEIIPKTLGATYWRKLSGFTANMLKVMIILLYPLVLLSQLITKVLSRGHKANKISRAEISAMADIGHKEGVFAEQESKMLKNLIKFKNIKAEDVMTPRIVMIASGDTITVDELYKRKNFQLFSRFPVYSGNFDNITGYVHKNDVLDKLVHDQHGSPLSEIKRNILQINQEMPITDLFDMMMEKREHIAVATDVFGTIAGIVTMEDIVETLLGLEIVDEFDTTEDMQAYAREKWRKRALELGIIESETEDIIKYSTTGGKAPGK